MSPPRRRECLACGFPAEPDDSVCPKCDAALARQIDGSTRSLDIAHAHQTVDEALDQLRGGLDRLRATPAARIRVVIGHGRIAEAVLPQLEHLRRTGTIARYEFDGRNHGAVIVHHRPHP
ncbi:MAG: hypothetical protein ACOCVS_03650 [Planctomycetota bacterium]